MLYAALSTDTQNTLKYHLVTVKPYFAVKTIDCLHQTGPTGMKMERLGMSLTCCTITMSIAELVAVSEMGVILHQTWSKSWQYCWNILLSRQILDAMKRVTDGILSFSSTVHWCLLHSTQSNCYSAKHPSSFFLGNGPKMVQSLTPMTRFRELHSSNSMSCE